MTLTRRDMLVNTAGGCASFAAAGLMAGPGCGFDVQFPEEISATYNEAQDVIRLELLKIAQLQNVGGSIILNVSDVPADHLVPENKLLLLRRDASTFVATWAICPHAGCPVGYSASERLIACPCHGSRFSAEGTCIGGVVRGPATAPLIAYKVDYAATDPEQIITIHLHTQLECVTAPTSPTVFVPTVTAGQIVLPFDKVPELKDPGGAKTFKPQGLNDTLFVIRQDATTAVALSAICTHFGCVVFLAASGNKLECHCHGSEFSLSGAVTRSPANRALKNYVAAVDATGITITVA